MQNYTFTLGKFPLFIAYMWNSLFKFASMKLKVQGLFIVLFLSTSARMHAQVPDSKLDAAGITKQPLNLEQCIDYALKNNIQIKQSR